MTKKLRARRPSGSVDRYLHAILLLVDHGEPADTGDLARKVGVSDAAASRMLRTLADKGFVRVEPYQGAQLTTEGLHRALRVVRRHRLLETYLHETMGFDLREAHERATLMQSTIDEVFEDKLDEMLGHPRFDPHGQPIPSKNATWPKVADSALVELPAGSAGRVSRVTSEDGDAITWLEAQGIAPGASIALEGVAPFDGPVAVRIGGKVVHLGRRLAAAVHVAEDESASPEVEVPARPGARRRPQG
jgi:DtxR family transcriptional regulator, Mn-dependent transcriptional regulator